MLDSKSATRIALKYRVDDGEKFRLAMVDPDDKSDVDKHAVKAWVRKRKETLATLQEALAATRTQSVLLVLQGMDAAGKDGMIRHVMGGVNPQGARVTSFKQPTQAERDHGYLWRVSQATPQLGEIGIFNRSHYEDVLVARVHRKQLDLRGLQGNPDHDDFWEDRLHDIRQFENYLTRQGVRILKVMLHISADEQRRRLLKRLDRPEKLWKFSASDLKERGYWNAYQKVYEHAIQGSASHDAPWYVVPANKKWFSRFVVLEALIDLLQQNPMKHPAPSPEIVKNLDILKTVLRKSKIPKKGIIAPEDALPKMPGITVADRSRPSSRKSLRNKPQRRGSVTNDGDA